MFTSEKNDRSLVRDRKSSYRNGGTEMRIVHVNYHASGGGAAIAARRLHHALLRHDVDSRMLVVDSSGCVEPEIVCVTPKIRRFCELMQRVEHGILRFDRDCRTTMPRSMNLCRTGVLNQIRRLKPDLVHLHWINGAMIGLHELSEIDCPVVWTLHDTWPFSGVEHHHAADDFRYRDGYIQGGDCICRWNWNRKRIAWANWRPHCVAPSRWILHEVSESVLLGGNGTTHIPNGIDLGLFSPGSRREARRTLGLPEEGKLVLFCAASAADSNKGGPELEAAFRLLKQKKMCDEKLKVLILGRGTLSLPFPVISPGFVSSQEELVACYRAADLFVLASKYDNLPNVLVEAAACGIPLVAFDVGGVSDIVISGENGILVPSRNSTALAEAIANMLSRSSGEFGTCSRFHAETNFNIETRVERYQQLYGEIIARNKP